MGNNLPQSYREKLNNPISDYSHTTSHDNNTKGSTLIDAFTPWKAQNQTTNSSTNWKYGDQ